MQLQDANGTDSAGLRFGWECVGDAFGAVQYDPDGTVLEVNATMLAWLGFAAEEVVGRNHHRFKAVQASSLPWAPLPSGGREPSRQRWTAKDGRPVWLLSHYSPVLDSGGTITRVVEIAANVTADALRQADCEGKLAAIRASHAVITFDARGIILDANDVFLDLMGYQPEQIVGRHHRTFVEPSYAHSAEYALFWRELAKGNHQAGQYRRFAKNGSEVWLQAIYNPVVDSEGTVVKVIKLAVPVTDEKRRQAEHQGQIAAIHKSLCVISFDMHGIICDANDNFLDATGYRLSEICGQHHRMFVEPAEAQSEIYRAFWSDLAAGRHQAGEFKRVGKDGREIWLQATYNPVLDLNGRPFRVVKYASVVTEQKLLQADLQGQISAIGKSQGIISFDLDGTIIEANENFCRSVGYQHGELHGQKHTILLEPDYAASPEYAEFWNTLRDGRFVSGLYRRVGKHGQTVWIQASYNPILDFNGRPSRVLKFATDVTCNVEMAKAYEDAKRQSQHDPATALPNRVRLLAFMTAILAQPDRRLAVLYLDLDGFKPINDSFGHQAGDHVLGHVADRLRRLLGSDQLAARIGGDEFIIAAPDLDEHETAALCLRAVEAVAAPIPFDRSELQVGVSIGVATTADGRSADELLRCADVAMYRSKQSGRGKFSFYCASLNDRLNAFQSLSDEIQCGLAEDQFILEYQPRFSTASNQMVSVEALVRWNHPTRGLLPPADFIPSAERSGLIIRLGEWVLREACQAAVKWAGIGISVNVSPAQFQSGTLTATVRTILEQTGLDPKRLELEITEGVVLGDGVSALKILDDLKQLGIRIAMDDFGTGYSSLCSLRSFAFDAIKIDRQFIADMDTREAGREVVNAILALARALSLSVTAEGVETARQLSMLTDDRCAEVQGFLPIPPCPGRPDRHPPEMPPRSARHPRGTACPPKLHSSQPAQTRTKRPLNAPLARRYSAATASTISTAAPRSTDNSRETPRSCIVTP